MKLLLTGCNGQLGRSLAERIPAALPGAELRCVDIDTLDLTDRAQVERYLTEYHPDVIVNCAAYTAVDRAEEDALAAKAVNVEAPANLAIMARRLDARMIHISTDYVFSGDSCRPYSETDEPYPRSIYGHTKLEGEGMVTSLVPDAVIIRTAWLYSEYGSNFVKTMLRLGRERGRVGVVADQIGTPTYAGDLADAIIAVLAAPEWHPGIYHFTDEGVASWYDFAAAIFELAGMPGVELTPILTKDYPTPAKRPSYSVLNKSKIKSTFNLRIPYWRESLAKMLNHND